MLRLPFEVIQELELNAWPDLLSVNRNGWRVRLAAGFTGRANSLTATKRGANLDARDLHEIEAIYTRHKLPTSIRITEFVADDLEARLEAHGYQAQNASEFRGMDVGPNHRIDESVTIAEQSSADWIEAFGRLNGRADFTVEAMAAILDRLVLKTGFARLLQNGSIVATGMAVIDRNAMEIQSIAVDPAVRGRGLGGKIVTSLLAWGQLQGTETAILSVAASNDPAIRLYSKLGFERIGGYHYRIKPRPASV